MIGIDALPGFITVLIFFELIYIEAERARVRFEQFLHVRSRAPSALFPIQRVVHLPELALKTGGFGRKRRFASVLMPRERKISKNDAQPRIVLLQQFLSERGELAARRTLEIGELFQRNRGIGVTADMRR